MKKRGSSFTLLISIFVALILLSIFVFMILVPEGKSYRILANEVEKKAREFSKLQMQYDQYFDKHTALNDIYINSMRAIENPFDKIKFIKKHSKNVVSLKVKIKKRKQSIGVHVLRNVEVTARFFSPKDFYLLMDDLNSSDWIMQLKTPIVFNRVGDKIEVTFTMVVYSLE